MMKLPFAISPIKTEITAGDIFAKLGLDLDLRSPQIALASETEAIDDGNATLDNVIDTTCIVDQANKTYSNSYTSNFATDDSWVGSNVGVSNGGGASIGGRSDVFRFHGDGINNTTQIQRACGNYRELAKITLDVYVPSTNVAAIGLLTSSNTGTPIRYVIDVPTRDEWVTVEIPDYYIYSGAGMQLLLFNGSTSAFDDLGESIYIDNMSVDLNLGHWAYQDTAADMPHYEQTTYFGLQGDGVDDIMNINDLSGWKTKVSGDTAGFFSVNFFDSVGAGVEMRIGGFGSAAGTGYIGEFRITTANELSFAINNGTAANTISFSVTAFRGGWFSIQVGSDGSDYFLWINGTLVAHTEVLNIADGSWINSFAAAPWNTFQLFANRVGTSYGLILRAFQYKSGRIPTQAEVDAINSSSLYTLP